MARRVFRLRLGRCVLALARLSQRAWPRWRLRRRSALLRRTPPRTFPLGIQRDADHALDHVDVHLIAAG
eukprot:7136834-Heterocapsa_arctica.AAC.1